MQRCIVDTLHATRAAAEEGVVPRGGMSLMFKDVCGQELRLVDGELDSAPYSATWHLAVLGSLTANFWNEIGR
jgi:hypothetical protein